MRAELARHFDVIALVWIFVLFVSWSVITLSRAPLTNAQWDQAPQAGPAWVDPAGAPGN